MFTKIKKGDTVGVIAPSSKIDEDDLEVINNSVLLMESTGLKVKFAKNNPVDVGLSISLLHGLENISSDYALCVTGDQPTVSTETFNKLIECAKNSKNPEKTISILRRRKTGLLDTAEGLGMPFVANKNQLINYLKNKNDNLNPILRKMLKDGFTYYGIKEKNELELLTINHYDDYKKVLDSF